MFETAAIVLAGGMSRRMGAANKLLIAVNGMPMIRASVLPYLEVCDGPVTVVTGHQSAQVEQALAGLELNLVFNPDFEKGQKTSVAAGLRVVAPAQATLIGLGDQPLLSAANLRQLLDTHRDTDPSRITLPENGTARGNPLIVPHQLKPMLLADRANPGCRKFTRENPEHVNRVALSDQAFFADIDTPRDLRTVLAIQEVAT